MPRDYTFTSKVADSLQKENPNVFVSDSWNFDSSQDDGLPISAEISMKNTIVNVFMTCDTTKKESGKKECVLTFESDKLSNKEILQAFHDVFPKTTTKYSFISK